MLYIFLFHNNPSIYFFLSQEIEPVLSFEEWHCFLSLFYILFIKFVEYIYFIYIMARTWGCGCTFSAATSPGRRVPGGDPGGTDKYRGGGQAELFSGPR